MLKSILTSAVLLAKVRTIMINSNEYTPNQVAAIIERLEGKFQFVLDVAAPLRDDMTEVKESLNKLEVEVHSLKDVIRVAVPDLSRRIQKLEAVS